MVMLLMGHVNGNPWKRLRGRLQQTILFASFHGYERASRGAGLEDWKDRPSADALLAKQVLS